MKTLLCYVAVHNGKIKRSSLEVLSRLRAIADAGGAAVEAIIADPNPASYAPEVGHYGARRVYLVKSDAFRHHLNEPLIRALSEVFRRSDAEVLAFASTEGIKDVLGALAVRLNASALSDVASVDCVEGRWTADRPVMAAKQLATTAALTVPVLVSIRSGSYPAVERPGNPDVVEVDFDDREHSRRPEVREVLEPAGETVDIAEASVVVAAGRGVRDPEGKSIVDELARVFNAATGATRAVVESGMYPATSQIGQTGKVVSPDLYFAIGISGAIQHVAGMVNSRVIVAINRDPEAPIFRYCTYGLVGDLYHLVPALTEELRKNGMD